MHFEIPYKDQRAMQRFYESVFGWKIIKLPDMDYHWVTTTESDPDTWVPKSPGAINGGMRQDTDGGGPIIVLTVQSIDERLHMVEEAGGKIILPKKEIGKHGFYAQVSDIEGNTLGLWQSKSCE